MLSRSGLEGELSTWLCGSGGDTLSDVLKDLPILHVQRYTHRLKGVGEHSSPKCRVMSKYAQAVQKSTQSFLSKTLYIDLP